MQVVCGAFYLPQKLTATWLTNGKVLLRNDIHYTAITIDKVSDVTVAYLGTKDGRLLQV